MYPTQDTQIEPSLKADAEIYSSLHYEMQLLAQRRHKYLGCSNSQHAASPNVDRIVCEEKHELRGLRG